MSVFLLMLVVIWLVGTLIRIYRQARFFQIEEYQAVRYLRWYLSHREQWPMCAITATLVGTVLTFFTDSIPGQQNIVSFVIMGMAALAAIWPQHEGEVKKAFVRTQRATRLLGAAFAIAVIFLLVAIMFLGNLQSESSRIEAIAGSLIGLVAFVLAPLWLILGNLVMRPVETFMRQQFLRKATRIMADINPRVIAITGSYGKTTTKNFVRDILNGRFKAYATPKSYNTLMGVSLAINRDLADDYSIDYFVAEMGMYVPGEIRELCEFTPPDISIVVEVGPQHLERAGSMDAIANAKYEIIEGLQPDGVGVFNWDNTYIRAMYEKGYPATRIAVTQQLSIEDAKANGVQFVATDVHENPSGLSFTVRDTATDQSQAMNTPIVGIHNVTNLLLATAVAVHEGMSLSDVAYRVRTLQPTESRLVQQITASGITIINDSYSTNPIGAISALRVLGMNENGRRVLITPGMVELGQVQDEENHKLGIAAADYATDIILVGDRQTKAIQAGLAHTDFPQDRIVVVDALGEATTWYQANLRSGDTVLFLNDLPDTY
ncbi:MAG: UDP-N-acetylmuramoyl-tripeptide--D-alanyl-D-alanine ligase [Anaerolineaceae bacterium]|nr:UDP-N-acetylmuramoyl-tripeptide--D-alanyl-D-alanine ligase [Anaerolineaceae bacterium]